MVLTLDKDTPTVPSESRDAFNMLLSNTQGALDDALTKAYAGLRATQDGQDPKKWVLSVKARAARAIVEGIECHHARNAGNLAAVIDAAHKATAFADEALCPPDTSGGINYDDWRA